MKIIKHLSLISIFLIVVLLIKKVSFDIEFYIKVINTTNSVAAGSIIISNYYLILLFISPIMSITGYMKKNKFRTLSLTLNIIGIIYLFIPLNLILF